MSEVISIHIGNTGIQTGLKMWELYWKTYEQSNLKEESKLGRLKLFRGIETKHRGLNSDMIIYSDPTSLKARALLVDVEADPINQLYKSTYSDLFDAENIITSGECTGSVYARVYRSLAPDLSDKIAESIRKEVERTSLVEGFNLTHSVSGGTGAGLWTSISEHLEEEYPKKERLSFDILSSDKLASTAVEPLNQALGMAKLVEVSRSSCFFEMTQISKIIKKALKDSPGARSRKDQFQNINDAVAYHSYKIMSGIALNNQHVISNLTYIARSVAMYPGLHFSSSSLSLEKIPLNNLASEWEGIKIQQTSLKTLNKHLNSTSVNPLYGLDSSSKHFNISALCQGEALTSKVLGQGMIMDLRTMRKLVDWAPCGFKYGLDCSLPPCLDQSRLRIPRQNVMILHTLTNFFYLIDKVLQRFERIYRKKLYLHHYDAEGMDFDEFELAVEKLKQCSEDYKEISQDLEDEDDEDDEDF